MDLPLPGQVDACIYPLGLSDLHEMPKLHDPVSADVVVVGGGLLGLSTALHLSSFGVETVLLEKAQIGGRASGRNGGQVTPGMARWKAQKMLCALPREDARWLWRFSSQEAIELLDNLLDTHRILADRQHGHLTAAMHPAHVRVLTDELAARHLLGEHGAHILDPHELQSHLHSPIYHGALLDNLGGQIHPQKLIRGLLRAFLQGGGKAYENSPVLSLRAVSNGTEVMGVDASIVARKAVVLAVHADTSLLQSQEDAMTLSLHSYLAATPPIEGGIRSLLPTGMPVYDTRLQIDYFRPYEHDRLLFGALGTSHRLTNEMIIKRLQQRMCEVFPHRDDLRPEFFWAEEFDITRSGLPIFRKSTAPVPVYTAYGWNGHGLVQTIRTGKAISDDFLRINHDFMKLTQFKHNAFPTRYLHKRDLARLAMLSARMVSFLRPHKMLSS
ncbi:NAD(P)/FAD-dependent oxidoreductase [Pseudomonas fluorescens]|uniref:NAD(P)/FAD-dependent oxidoreductase n=1 Tax=Pseudomonas fluorescens TaxID=294 RepID=UPI0009372269|nr:FAD-dependent oxidoreductase [Pseudomonas fluorescens]